MLDLNTFVRYDQTCLCDRTHEVMQVSKYILSFKPINVAHTKPVVYGRVYHRSNCFNGPAKAIAEFSP